MCAIVVAGGSGSRFGAPKQFVLVAGRRVLDRSVEVARTVAGTVVLVLPEEALADASCRAAADVVVAGGPTRAASVRCGIAAAPADAAVLVVHDAARPLAPARLFRDVVAAVREGADAAIPVLPLVDTLKRVRSGRVVGTLERDGLVSVQTPQAFRADVLRRAHEGGGEASDDAGLVEALGAEVVVVPGDAANLKLTAPSDLPLLEALATLTREAPAVAAP